MFRYAKTLVSTSAFKKGTVISHCYTELINMSNYSVTMHLSVHLIGK